MIALGLAAFCLLLADVLTGPAAISVSQFADALFDTSATPSAHTTIVWQLRLPQALMALLVGAALGLAGAEMQTVLDNPLASPFTLGVSSAAALGAALTLVLQWHPAWLPVPVALTLSAFALGLACTLIMDYAARRAGIGTSGIVLLGIALVFSFNAALSLIQLLANPHALQDLVFWTMGSLARSNWQGVALLSLALAVLVPWSWRHAWQLTALRFGDDRAASLGVSPTRVRRHALLRASLLASVSVALVGVIGFVGLMAPHIARRLWGDNHRWYLPASALSGAVIVLGASVLAKQISQQISVPAGIVTTLVGIPFFILIVLHGRRS